MSAIIAKIKEKYARGGVQDILHSAWQGLLARTVHRLDHWLFWRHKWSCIHAWMLNPVLYHFFRLSGFTEAEHQIGRLMHMRAVLQGIARKKLTGDLVEFGTYQGFGLSWLARFRNELGLNFRIIGIDSFQGLPESSTIWKKGLFSDTSRDECERNILKALKTQKLSDENIFLLTGLFDEPRIARELASLTPRVLIAHIDCDLGSSCTQALQLLRRTGPAFPQYLFFDDWYCHPDEIPLSFSAFIRSEMPSYEGRKISTTRYTRYMELCTAAPEGKSSDLLS